MSIISLKNINKSYGNRILFKDFNLDIEKGELVSIMGPSGKGKSTLLNMIGLLEKVDSGDIVIEGIKNPKINSKEGVKLLRNKISYLFQNYGLIEEKTVFENLKIGTKFLKLNKDKEKIMMVEALETVELSKDILDQKIYHLSGGEQQRVALAKIILKPSEIILADEPTGSLDEKNRDSILNILKNINKKGKTIVVVTHDPKVEECATRRIRL